MSDNSLNVRLQKFIADAGYCSRRAAEEYIKNGKVTVNGVVAEIGTKINPEKDRVSVNGKALRNRENPKSYFMLYKPRGYVTTMKDEDGRRCITDLLHGISQRVFPVGRLDRDSEGLLILTNDGELSLRLTHPSKHFPKTYRVTVNGEVTPDEVKKLTAGVVLDDGYKTEPCIIKTQKRDDGKTVMYITITEGKNRQIRRMLETINAEVIILKRISYGNLNLTGVAVGKYRVLTPEEIKYLKSL